MASIERTAYPRLKKSFTETELKNYYVPTEDEIYFVKNRANGEEPQLHLLIMLKTFQRLGYFPRIEDVPEEVVRFSRATLQFGRNILPLVSARTLYKHQAAIRRFLDVKAFDKTGRKRAARAVLTAAETMDNPADLINVAVEELIKERYELTAFSTLDLLVRRYRNFVNRRLFSRIYNRLSPFEIQSLNALLEADNQTYRTPYNRLKELPERPSLSHLQQLLDQYEWLTSLANTTEKLAGVPPLKIKHFAALAKTLDAAEIKDFAARKRAAVILCLIHRARIKTRDFVAEMFVKRMMKFHQLGKEALEAQQLASRAKTERLLTIFTDVLHAVKNNGSSEKQIGANVKSICESHDLESLLEECESVSAVHGDNYFPLVWKFYRSHRGILYRLIKSMQFVSTSQDKSLMEALDFLIENEKRRGDYLETTVDLSFAAEKWQKIIVQNISGEPFYDRRHFEVCVFSQLMAELKSGDIAIEGSEEYADYREQLLEWEECEPQVEEYCREVELPATAAEFIHHLKARLSETADKVDKSFPRNAALSFSEKGELVLKRMPKRESSAKIRALETALQEQMPERHLLDILAGVEHHTNLTRHFGPLSGSDPKIDRPVERYLLMLFTYGCNLGPAQAARHMRGLVSGHMLGFVNNRHVNAKKLDSAREEILNHYHRFTLPRFWGDGSRVSADGTKYELSDQNLMAEYHIRYGGYGGIAYYHVSDLYVALFSHFIACGTWEAVYIIDGLLKNKSEIQPDTVHADTQGQSTPVFGLSYLLGIELQPRIRNIKDLVFYRSDKKKKYKHLENLFGDPVDWELIETHWQDLMRVVLSIKAGKVLPSTLLRKLSNYSRRNRLYQAYRELGRAVRTIYLLKYISDPELREEVHAQTNRVEAFNGFVKWFYFGGESTIWENDPEEQEKSVKYNTLIADAVIFQNVIDQTRIIEKLIRDGFEMTAEDLKALSPYLTKHIKRFGDYVVDMSQIPPPLEIEYTFSLDR